MIDLSPMKGASPKAVREAYGANYARLAALKAAVDPKNLFRLNQQYCPRGLKGDMTCRTIH